MEMGWEKRKTRKTKNKKWISLFFFLNLILKTIHFSLFSNIHFRFSKEGFVSSPPYLPIQTVPFDPCLRPNSCCTLQRNELVQKQVNFSILIQNFFLFSKEELCELLLNHRTQTVPFDPLFRSDDHTSLPLHGVAECQHCSSEPRLFICILQSHIVWILQRVSCNIIMVVVDVKHNLMNKIINFRRSLLYDTCLPLIVKYCS
jgi:hypothetical protein